MSRRSSRLADKAHKPIIIDSESSDESDDDLETLPIDLTVPSPPQKKETKRRERDDDANGATELDLKLEPVIPFCQGYAQKNRQQCVEAMRGFGVQDGDDEFYSLHQTHFQADEAPAPGRQQRVPRKPLFKPIPNCRDINDWLANYHEPGQSFKEYWSFVSMRSGTEMSTHAIDPISVYRCTSMSATNIEKSTRSTVDICSTDKLP